MNKLNILVCENYMPEYKEAIKREGFTDVEVKSFPCLCDYPHKKKMISKIVESKELEYQNTVLICNKTCGIYKKINEFHVYKAYALTNCLSQLIHPQLLEYMTQNGGYTLTTGWLLDWKKRLKSGGFDRETAQRFYKEFCKEFVFFDVGIDPDAENKMKELSDYFDIPYRIIPLELDYLLYFLRSIVYEWRLNKKSRKCQQEMDDLIKQNSDYAALLDIMHRISLAQNQRETIDKLQEIFLIIFGAKKCKFWGSNNKEIQSKNIKKLFSSTDDYYYCKRNKEFYIKVAYNNQVFGVFEVGDFLFSDHIEKYLNLSIAIIKVSGLVISNVQRYELIIKAQKELEFTNIHDSLTGLYNRTYYNYIKNQGFESDNIAIFICDIDDLKYINDNLGHLEGDKLICLAAEILKQSFREKDIIARIGGDEFIAIGMDSDLENTEMIYKRIEKNIMLNNKNNGLKISLSVGYSVLHSKDFTFDEIVKEADAMMYKIKRKNKLRGSIYI